MLAAALASSRQCNLGLIHFFARPCMVLEWQEAVTESCISAGQRHALTYDQLKARFPHVAPTELQAILREALIRKQAESNPGLTSLLIRGTTCRPLEIYHSFHLTTNGAHAPDQNPGSMSANCIILEGSSGQFFNVVSHAARAGAEQHPRLEQWLRALHGPAILARKLSLRQTGKHQQKMARA